MCLLFFPPFFFFFFFLGGTEKVFPLFKVPDNTFSSGIVRIHPFVDAYKGSAEASFFSLLSLAVDRGG